jgi:hypothetical protein
LLRNEFSPINRLPTETLSHIFDLVCIQDQDDTHVSPYHATKLAQVCSQWRSDVISTPLLWSTIHVSQKTQPEFIALCLERSKEVPLEIILEIRGGLLEFASLPAYPRSNTSPSVRFCLSLMTSISTMTRSVDLLIANSNRAQRFSFRFEHEFPNRQSHRLGQIASEEIFKRFLAPGLVSLEWDAGVNITAITRGSTIHLPEPFVERSLSNLQSLSLKNSLTGPAHGVRNLKSFHLAYTGELRTDITPRRLHEFLSRNTTLEHISLERCALVPDPERDLQADPVVLSHLTTLKLDQFDVPVFFRVASVPSVATITSVYLDPLASVMRVNSSDRSVEINTSPSAWDAIRTFTEVRIDTFHLQGNAPPAFGFGKQPWRALLHKATTFRILQIAGNVHGYKEALVLSLSLEPDQFANLETLRLDANSNASTTAFKAIAEIAESRAKRGRHLTKVECLHIAGGSAVEKWKELYDLYRIQDHLLDESE